MWRSGQVFGFDTIWHDLGRWWRCEVIGGRERTCNVALLVNAIFNSRPFPKCQTRSNVTSRAHSSDSWHDWHPGICELPSSGQSHWLLLSRWFHSALYLATSTIGKQVRQSNKTTVCGVKELYVVER
jgi:hypothetical protein